MNALPKPGGAKGHELHPGRYRRYKSETQRRPSPHSRASRSAMTGNADIIYGAILIAAFLLVTTCLRVRDRGYRSRAIGLRNSRNEPTVDL